MKVKKLNINNKSSFRDKLTGDVVVDVPLELQAHVVGAELLEFDGEFNVLLRLVTVHQHVRVEHRAATLRLLPLHQIQLEIFIISALVRFGADDIQLVPDVWVDDETFSRKKSGRGGGEKRKTSCYSQINEISLEQIGTYFRHSLYSLKTFSCRN